MISKTILESLECALSTHLKHISINPISLACGHTLCQDCSQINIDKEITCIHCNKNQALLKNQSILLSGKCLFNTLIDDLFKNIADKFNQTLTSIKEENFETNLKKIGDKLKNEIDIKVEFFKEKLDSFKNDFFGQIDRIQNDILKNKFGDSSSERVLSTYEKYYHDLKDYNNQVKEKTQEQFAKFQTFLRNLYEIKDNISKKDFKINFIPSNQSIYQSLIGNINYGFYWLFDSKILSSEALPEIRKICQINPQSYLSLKYRSSRDGIEKLEANVKDKNLLAIIKSDKNDIFGGLMNSDFNSQMISQRKLFRFQFKTLSNFSKLLTFESKKDDIGYSGTLLIHGYYYYSNSVCEIFLGNDNYDFYERTIRLAHSDNLVKISSIEIFSIENLN